MRVGALIGSPYPHHCCRLLPIVRPRKTLTSRQSSSTTVVGYQAVDPSKSVTISGWALMISDSIRTWACRRAGAITS